MSLQSTSVSRNIFFRKLFLFLSGSPAVSRGFIPDVCNLLCRYRLTHILQLHVNLPSKYVWKHQVQSAVNAQESELWRQRLRTDCDFVRFRKLHTAIVPCIVWKFPNTRTELKLADFIGQLWTCIPDSQHSVCRLCNGVTEDILCHAVAECICTSPFRDTFLDTIHS